MNKDKMKYKFIWYIENYSYCWHKNAEKIVSPEFTLDGLEGTSWNIRLYPRRKMEQNSDKICLYLARSQHDAGPKTVSLKFHLTIVSAYGSPVESSSLKGAFEKGYGYGYREYPVTHENILLLKAQYLPQDTLTVRCTMWKDDGDFMIVEQLSARTRIGVEKLSFLHKVENFSALKSFEKNKFQIPSHSKKGCDVSSSLYFTYGSCTEGEVFNEIAVSNTNYIIHKQKLFLLDGSEKVIECAESSVQFDTMGTYNQKLSLTRKEILEKKNEYLPNDELSLLCECSFSTGIEFEKIEEIQYQLPAAALKQILKNDKTKNAEVKLSERTSASEDMKSVYINQYLTDVKVETKTKAFPAHKIVLCARSPVFKTMLTSDMEERNTDCIQIDDLEDDIVQQLLLFLYSDDLENLQWESSIKLYYAADKYAIEKLKIVCSSFLIANVNASTAFDLLLLAETHNDSELRNAAEEFILNFEEKDC